MVQADIPKAVSLPCHADPNPMELMSHTLSLTGASSQRFSDRDLCLVTGTREAAHYSIAVNHRRATTASASFEVYNVVRGACGGGKHHDVYGAEPPHRW
jgi:hypothetical protein